MGGLDVQELGMLGSFVFRACHAEEVLKNVQTLVKEKSPVMSHQAGSGPQGLRTPVSVSPKLVQREPSLYDKAPKLAIRAGVFPDAVRILTTPRTSLSEIRVAGRNMQILWRWML
jgi:hypothetical protein